MSDWKTRKVEECLNTKFTDISGLKRQCWNGIPPRHRSLTWKILLGYAPTNTSRRSSTISKRRLEYHQRYVQHSTQALSNDPQHVRLHQSIQKDVLRTAPSICIFRDSRVQDSMVRLLYVHACRHPATSYIQGLNDIVAPFFIVFLAGHYNGIDMSTLKDIDFVTDDILAQVEADSYYCLGKFIAGIQDHYTTGQPGIQHMIFQLEKCLKRIDSELHEHIVVRCQLNILHFSFRWMACLLVRELSLPCIVRIWDTYLCQEDDTKRQSIDKKGFDEFHVCVCAAILHSLRHKLLKMGGDELMEFLTMRMKGFATKELGPRDADLWLSQAHVWQLEGVLDDVMSDDSDVSGSGNNSYFAGTDKQEIEKGTSYEPPTTSMSNVDFLCY